jgi:hypothetical protein
MPIEPMRNLGEGGIMRFDFAAGVRRPRVALGTSALLVAVVMACDTHPDQVNAPAVPSRIIVRCDTCHQTFPPIANPRVGIVDGSLGQSDDAVRRAMGFAKRAGVSIVREEVRWPAAEPNGPSLDPGFMSQLHAYVQAVLDSGMTPYLTLQDTPFWALDPSNSFATEASPPAAGMWAWWRQFVADIVAAEPRVTYWGVWDEPNYQNQQDSTGFLNLQGMHTSNWFDAYYPMFGYAADAIQAAPGRILVGPELGWGPSLRGNTLQYEWGQFVQALGYRIRPQDVLTVHYYDSATAGILERSMQWIADTAAAHGLGQNNIWVTELAGYGPWEFNDALQDSMLTADFQAALSTRVSRWTKSFRFELTNFAGFELVPNAWTDPNAQPRPAYYCLRALAYATPLPTGCQHQ